MYLREAGGFYYALSHREFAATDRVVQPGVTTLWLGTIGYLLRFPDYNELGELYIADLHFDLLLKKAQLIPLQILVYAPARMMIGWGEGLDEAARFLNRQADLKHKKVYAWYASAQNCHFSEIAEDLPISQPIMT
ncbi:MAG TPA: hypothetical protein VLA49_07600, partial [Anaerolineales bacterium]|nr:hypothetical protein [Anaerolineales bacterium]